MVLTTKHFGIEIPVIGFGTWQLDARTARRCVAEAISAGYRMIDTAQIYDNESAVGDGIRDSGIARDQLWVTTKVWMSSFKDGDLQQSVTESLERLKLDYADLILLHWPTDEVPLDETLAALNETRDLTMTRHIGVSNFTTSQLREAVRLSDAPILTNQVEYHPFIDQQTMLETARELKLAITAYSPLAQGKVFESDVIGRIAKKYGKSQAQITVRWAIQQPGVITLPRSSSNDHLRSNREVHDFELTDDEMREIASLRSQHERIVDPDWAPEWDKAQAA